MWLAQLATVLVLSQTAWKTWTIAPDPQPGEAERPSSLPEPAASSEQDEGDLDPNDTTAIEELRDGARPEPDDNENLKDLIEKYGRNSKHFDEVVQRAKWDKSKLKKDVLLNEFSVDARRQAYSKGRFSWQVLAGVEMRNSGASFSELNEYVRFLGDTSFAGSPGARGQLHGIVDLSLSTIPVGETEDRPFLDSEKAFTGSLGVDYLPLEFDRTLDGHQGSAGFAARGGLQILEDDPSNDSSNNEFWAVGLTFRTAPVFRYSDPNPVPYAFATILYGDYDTLDDHALTFDGLIRFVSPDVSPTDNPWGLFVGARAIVNFDEGDDDLRLQVGVEDGLALLKDLFELPKTLFGSEETPAAGGS